MSQTLTCTHIHATLGACTHHITETYDTYKCICTSSSAADSSRTDWIDWTDWLDRHVEEVGERGNVLPMLVVSLSSTVPFLRSESETAWGRGRCFGLLCGGDCFTEGRGCEREREEEGESMSKVAYMYAVIYYSCH